MLLAQVFASENDERLAYPLASAINSGRFWNFLQMIESNSELMGVTSIN